jgi:hypothetical protein
LYSDELGLELGLAILKKHAHDFLKVALKLIEGLALAMGSGPPWNVPNEKAGVWVTLNDEIEAPHGYPRLSGYAGRWFAFNGTVCRTLGISCEAPCARISLGKGEVMK